MDEILPRLQGTAAELLFDQLSAADRSDYSRLTTALESRFRVIETPKQYAAQFSHRDQHQGESIIEYACDLKRLYNKAFPDRDRRIRDQDLLRRFLDGLQDNDARFHIEFVKDPQDIEDAEIECIKFFQARSGPRVSHGDGEDRPQRRRGDIRAVQSQNAQPEETSTDPQPNGQDRHTGNQSPSAELSAIIPQLQAIFNLFPELWEAVAKPPSNYLRPIICYKCGEPGHTSNKCTKNIQGYPFSPTTAPRGPSNSSWHPPTPAQPQTRAPYNTSRPAQQGN